MSSAFDRFGGGPPDTELDARLAAQRAQRRAQLRSPRRWLWRGGLLAVVIVLGVVTAVALPAGWDVAVRGVGLAAGLIYGILGLLHLRRH